MKYFILNIKWIKKNIVIRLRIRLVLYAKKICNGSKNICNDCIDKDQDLYLRICKHCHCSYRTTRRLSSTCKRLKRVNCEECGKIFYKVCGSKKRFCSHSCATKNKDVSRKRAKSLTERYGENVSNPFQASECKEKIKKTFLKEYGVEYPTQSSDIVLKSKRTLKSKYGMNVKAPINVPSIKAKMVATNRTRYGSDTPLQNADIWKRTIENRKITHISKGQKSLSDWIEKEYPYLDMRINDISFLSHLRDKNIDVDNHNFLEIDIYLPELKIGIEYNGNHFHDIKTFNDDILLRRSSPKGREMKKTVLSMGLGLEKFINIWESDWTAFDKRKELKDLLRTTLNESVEDHFMDIKNPKGDIF